MPVLRRLLNYLPLFWLLLAIPGVLMLYGWATGAIDTVDMLHPTGETSARLMILAMIVGPLSGLIGPRRWLAWWMRRRRSLGVAAFAYATAHLFFYILDMGELAAIFDELPLPAIWTGWAALALMLPLALTSNDAAMRRLRRGWKQLQRLAYPAALLTLLHWWWVHNGLAGALAHFAPLALIWLALAVRRARRSSPLPQQAQGV